MTTYSQDEKIRGRWWGKKFFGKKKKKNVLWSGKKLKSVFDFFTYSRETWFSFCYLKVGNLIGANEPSNEIDRVSKYDNSLSFGAKQNALRQIFFEL